MNSLSGVWRMAGSQPAESSYVPHDAIAFLVSLIAHLAAIVVFGLIPIHAPSRAQLILQAVRHETEPEFELPHQWVSSEFPDEAIGSNGVDGADALRAMAPDVSDLSDLESPLELLESKVGSIQLSRAIEWTTGPKFNANLAIKGAAGEGLQGAEGAIDRLTEEILASLEERKTLVIWLLDQSPSLSRQHRLIHDRLDRIYEELGVLEASGNSAFAARADKPLLTRVYWFGEHVRAALKDPTDNIETIKKAVSNIPVDPSGIERVFSAVYLAARDASRFRDIDPETGEPERNVMIIVFTDEAGEDQDGLESTVKVCRKDGVSVSVVGAPAPFGRKETFFKYTDPDGAFDQSVRWFVVDQGPESLYPERLRIAFPDPPEEEVPIDSGFGPYALTRLCVETGGTFYSVHPNRRSGRSVSRGETDAYAAHIEHFFDSDAMRRYRPDYVPQEEYERRVKANAMRSALVAASQLSWIRAAERPVLRFVPNDAAQFAALLSEAQKTAALLEPSLQQLHEILRKGESARDQEASPRWQAGYDLAMGRLLAVKVRTEAYNAMLARARRGMSFSNPRDNTWVMEPAESLADAGGGPLDAQAERARFYLRRVIDQHPDTPWAHLANQELESPFGWKWVESFTDRSPRPAPPAGPPSPSNPPPNSASPPGPNRPVEPAKPARAVEFKKL
ncbi:MAG: VWA domain-containing protein [Planctomycetes bacterium]|nr:VWA domain-containing protein [Planctomycetota bacterium]